MQPITARYIWMIGDIAKGGKYVARTKPFWRIFQMILPVMVIGACISATYAGSEMPPGLTLVLMSLSIGWLLRPFFRYTRARLQFGKRLDANMEIQWVFAESGINTSSSIGKSDLQWTAFQTVYSTPEGFLFMPSPRIFHFIPTRAFTSPADIESVKTLARQHATVFKEMK